MTSHRPTISTSEHRSAPPQARTAIVLLVVVGIAATGSASIAACSSDTVKVWKMERAEEQQRAAIETTRKDALDALRTDAQSQPTAAVLANWRQAFVSYPKDTDAERVERTLKVQQKNFSPEKIVAAPFLADANVGSIELRGDRERYEPRVMTALRQGRPELALTARDSFRVEDASRTSFAIHPKLVSATDVLVEHESGLAVYRGGAGKTASGKAVDLVQRATDEGVEDFALFPDKPSAEELTYRVQLTDDVAGLRQISGTNLIEFVDASGTPRLRMNAPVGMDASGDKFALNVRVEGCAVDTNPSAPWGRTPVNPGARTCTIHMSWEGKNIAYPAIVDPSWFTTGSMAAGRGWHAGIRLKNGLVLAAGGLNLTPATPTAELYNSTSGTWAATGEMPPASAAGDGGVAEAYLLPAGAALGAGNVFVLGSGKYAAMYDTVAGTWAAAPTMLNDHGQYYGSVQLADGKIYATCNSTGGGATGVVHEVYDPAANTWTNRAALPQARGFLYRRNIQPISNTKYVVLGGTGGTSPLIYDAAADTWTVGATPLTAGGYLITTTNKLPNGKILIAASGSSETYDPATGTVQDKVTLNAPTGVENDSILTASGVVVALGGTVEHGFRIYDPVAKTWSALNATPGNVSISDFPRMVSLDSGSVLAFGGSVAVDSGGRADSFILGCRVPSETADCGVDAYCDDNGMGANVLGQCRPKRPNNSVLPGTAPFGGTCSAANASRACLSGVCSTTDNKCGWPNGVVPKDVAGNATIDPSFCRSNVINLDGLCGDPNAVACVNPTAPGGFINECRSGVCFTEASGLNPADSRCGLPNGEPCAVANQLCRTVCVAADNRCGLLNGSPCVAAAECRTAICNADGKCGVPNGDACPASGSAGCRSGVCDLATNKCSGQCGADADCAAGNYCELTRKACTPAESNSSKTGAFGSKTTNCDPARAARECQSGVCNADGKCGDPDGATCTAPTTCRTSACTGGKCGVTCVADKDCPANAYCEDGSKQCVADEPNGSMAGPNGNKATKCTRDGQCQSASCATDGVCGLVDGTACSAGDVCRNGSCASGFCGAACRPGGATGDQQCAPNYWCSGVAADASGTCKLDAANGAKPIGANCTRPSQCLSNICFTDGTCGLPDGQVCGDASNCRTNVCLGGVCGGATGCTSDAQCAGDKFCKNPGGAGICTAKLPNDQACTRGGECQAAICKADGKCGVPKDDSCGSSLICRTNLCDNVSGKCSNCQLDSQCSSTQACVQGVCVEGCRGVGSPSCTAPLRCTSTDTTIGKCVECTNDKNCGAATSARICEANKCVDGCRGTGGNTCASPKVCSSSNATAGTCNTPATSGCKVDTECKATQFCDLAVSPGACVDKKPNSQPCKATTQCVSNVCDADGKCGSPDGVTCAVATTCRTGACTSSICGTGTSARVVDGSLEGGGIGCSTTTGGATNTLALLGFAAFAASLIGRRRQRQAR